MHKFIRSSLFVLIALLAALTGHAQGDGDKVEMADTLRSNGKIYVVVIVVVTILAGLILYVIRLDRKIGRMEAREQKR
jgi:prepilin signal peptidase PulO-like enzyme (type II secretory pathway)